MPLLALLVECVETVPLKNYFILSTQLKLHLPDFFIVKLSSEALTLHQSPSLVHLLL